MLSHHVVWEVCVTVSKERSSFHLQGGTYTIRRMVGGYKHGGGRWCFHLQCRIFTCCSLEYGYTHFRGTYCHKLQIRNFTLHSLVGGYQYFGGICCFSNDITMCFSRWLACVTANFSLQLQDLTCTIFCPAEFMSWQMFQFPPEHYLLPTRIHCAITQKTIVLNYLN